MDTDAVSQFVRDAIAALEALGARDETEYLRTMLEYDGSSLVKYGAVTVAWIDRLAAINDAEGGLFDEELAELREGISTTEATAA